METSDEEVGTEHVRDENDTEHEDVACSPLCVETVRDLKCQIRNLNAELTGMRKSDEKNKIEISRLKAENVHLKTISGNGVGKNAATKLKNIANAILQVAGGDAKGNVYTCV